ncbi:MAG: hypothetical protein HKM93_10675 [Desulfobacteraceae bacterium]|nr:hypothetical protein [Desulfobacteraceae bacterium]
MTLSCCRIGRMVAIATLLFVISWGADQSFGAGAKKMDGWEKDGKYNSYYNPRELDYFYAWVVKIKSIVPLPGMTPALALEIKEDKDDDESIIAHLCPTWYMEKQQLALKKGDRVKIKGSWAHINGADVLMVSKIKKGDYYELKVRLTNDGTPFWSLTPEELEKEKRSQ